MELRKIEVSSRFERSYRRLPARIKESAKKQERIFRNNPFDARLETHKLHGKDKEAWAFGIGHKYRIKFIFLTERKVLFLDVGTHDIYK